MNLSKPFILRPVATSLLMLALLLLGLLGYQLLPVSALPSVDYPTIRLSTFYPGAGPEVIASAITAPLERQLGQMPGLNQMNSTSSSGTSIIVLQFNLTMGLDIAEQEVQAAINAATNFLPSDLPNPPTYSKINPADTPILTLALHSKTLPLTQIEDLADTRLAQKISQLDGVGLVSISGGQRPAIRIQANPTALAAYGLTLEDIRTSISNANVNAPKGSFDGKSQAYTINANDQLLTSAEYKDLIIAYNNGAPIRLSDVALVKEAAENLYQAAWMNNEPAVILNIQRQPGTNVIEVVDRIKKLLPKLRDSLPSTIEVNILSDRTLTIRASVKEAQVELLTAIALVVMVIFIFLRNIPATIIPGICVPLSLIGTFSVMYLLHFSINNLTLMALIIATGFVVDDAIVMIENIARFIEKGENPKEAALQGAKQIGFTILSLTISLIAVLIPLFFMGDIVGLLFKEFALTLTITILISAVISLTLTPMLCAHFLKNHSLPSSNGFERLTEKFLNGLAEKYVVTLRVVVEHQGIMLVIIGITVLLTASLFYHIPKGFFPEQDTGIIQGISEAPQSISFQAMSERQQAIAKEILKDKAVESLSSFIGIDGTNITMNSGRFLISLTPIETRDSAAQVIKRLQDKLADIAGIKLYMQSVQDLSIDDRASRTQFQYSIGGPDVALVSLWTDTLVDKLKSKAELMEVASDQQNAGLQLYLTIDRNTASRFGITPLMISDTLYDAFGQRQISTLFTELNQYHVVLEILPEFNDSVKALDNLYINSITGGPVPLKAFTSITKGKGPLVINRQGQFPVSTVSFNLSPGIALGEAVNILQASQEEIGMPLSLQTNFEGTAQIFQAALANEGWLVCAAIIVVYIVLGVLYESYIHPITILSTLPSAAMGALLALQGCGKELSIIALIGIILLIGIVMKNAIMMIDFALEMERIHNKSPFDSILEACALRFRPILMTTMAALLGAVPLAFGSGMGAELRQPLGIAIIGGLALSQLLTLYTTPVIYLTFDKIGRMIKKRFITP